MKKIIFFFLFFLLVPITNADYFFDTSQCKCDNGLELTASKRQWNLLKCEYRMEGSKTYIRPKMTVEVRTYISERFLRNAKERYQKDYDSYSTSTISKFYFDDFDIVVSLQYFQT